MELSPSGSVALVVGVTGMVGLSLVQSLKNPTAPGSPWTVYGSSRRPPPPRSPLDRFVQLDALDRDSTVRTLSPLAPHVTHLFFLALAARDTEESNIAANSAMLDNVLHALTAPTGSHLRHVALQTGSKHYYMDILLEPARSGRVLRVPFREDSPRLACPLFYHALEDILVTYSHKLTWTVHRASIILGASHRSIYNVLLTLATYALICKKEGSHFAYPGSLYTWQHLCDATDAELVAEQQIWAAAATSDAGKGEAFNCTNGDVFTWRSFWKVLAEVFEVEFVECDGSVGFEWVRRMEGKGEVWDAIVKENGLVETRLEEIACFGAVYAILNFGFEHVSSMDKSREFGFCKSVDTLKSIGKWVEKLRDMNIIPRN